MTAKSLGWSVWGSVRVGRELEYCAAKQHLVWAQKFLANRVKSPLPPEYLQLLGAEKLPRKSDMNLVHPLGSGNYGPPECPGQSRQR